MGWTKQQLISEAYGALALQGYEFDISPDEQQMALRRMDTMLATWEARGVRIGYAFPAGPDDSDVNSDAGVPDYAVEAVYLNLAQRIAGGYGKALDQDARAAAKNAYDVLLWQAAQPIQQQLPATMPRGAGNRAWRNSQRPFMNKPDDSPLQIQQGGDLNVLPE